MFCAVNRGRLVTRAEIARACNSSENHLGQIVNQLGQLGLITTLRGRGGGLKLARDPAGITVGEVFRTFEADTPVAECFADVDNTCPLIEACRLRGAIMDAVQAFYGHLDGLTLESLVCGNVALDRLLNLEPACTPAKAS